MGEKKYHDLKVTIKIPVTVQFEPDEFDRIMTDINDYVCALVKGVYIEKDVSIRDYDRTKVRTSWMY